MNPPQATSPPSASIQTRYIIRPLFPGVSKQCPRYEVKITTRGQHPDTRSPTLDGMKTLLKRSLDQSLSTQKQLSVRERKDMADQWRTEATDICNKTIESHDRRDYIDFEVITEPRIPTAQRYVPLNLSGSSSNQPDDELPPYLPGDPDEQGTTRFDRGPRFAM